MTTTQLFAFGFLAVWIGSAVTLGVVMQRRGYSGFGWGVIGVALGPIGILLALVAHNPLPPDKWARAGLPAPGPIDALIATDGSATSLSAAAAAIDVLGDRLGRVTLATVAPYDANTEGEARARHALELTSRSVADRLTKLSAIAGAVVLHGRPDDALRDRARAGGYDVIVVGSHGHGASKALLGSVTASLVAEAEVPLIVTGRMLAVDPLPSSEDAAQPQAVDGTIDVW